LGIPPRRFFLFGSRNILWQQEEAVPKPARFQHRKGKIMSTTGLIILIVVLFLVFGGGGGYYMRRGRR
jgi:hypothetical protein